jgi:hypothetical protein
MLQSYLSPFQVNLVEKTIKEKNVPKNIHPTGDATHGIVTGGGLTIDDH